MMRSTDRLLPSLLLLLLLSLSLSLLLPPAARAFVHPTTTATRCIIADPSSSRATTTPAAPLSAKNDEKKRGGEGFGKRASSASSPSAVDDVDDDDDASDSSPRFLRSVESAAAAASSSASSSPPPPPPQLPLDPSLSPEERSRTILRSKFGLKSYEEQQASAGDYRALLESEKKKERRDKLRNVERLWPEDKTFLEVLPPSVIKGIDAFLKLGLGVSTLAFLTAGVFITAEAGSKATGSELPGGLEEFVVNVVEPNFTPGLGVLLGFSVTLGLFSVVLGGSASSTYRENP